MAGASGRLAMSAITSRKKCPVSWKNVDRSAVGLSTSSSVRGLNVPRGPWAKGSSGMSSTMPSDQVHSGISPVFWSANTVSSTLAVRLLSP